MAATPCGCCLCRGWGGRPESVVPCLSWFFSSPSFLLQWVQFQCLNLFFVQHGPSLYFTYVCCALCILCRYSPTELGVCVLHRRCCSFSRVILITSDSLFTLELLSRLPFGPVRWDLSLYSSQTRDSLWLELKCIHISHLHPPVYSARLGRCNICKDWTIFVLSTGSQGTCPISYC